MLRKRVGTGLKPWGSWKSLTLVVVAPAVVAEVAAGRPLGRARHEVTVVAGYDVAPVQGRHSLTGGVDVRRVRPRGGDPVVLEVPEDDAEAEAEAVLEVDVLRELRGPEHVERPRSMTLMPLLTSDQLPGSSRSGRAGGRACRPCCSRCR